MERKANCIYRGWEWCESERSDATENDASRWLKYYSEFQHVIARATP